jgi:hypothetical protein
MMVFGIWTDNPLIDLTPGLLSTRRRGRETGEQVPSPSHGGGI